MELGDKRLVKSKAVTTMVESPGRQTLPLPSLPPTKRTCSSANTRSPKQVSDGVAYFHWRQLLGRKRPRSDAELSTLLLDESVKTFCCCLCGCS